MKSGENELHEEMIILATAMVDPIALEAMLCKHRLLASDFVDKSLGVIWSACVILWHERKPIDIVQIAMWMNAQHPHMLDAIGGIERLACILNESQLDNDIEACVRAMKCRKGFN